MMPTRLITFTCLSSAWNGKFWSHNFTCCFPKMKRSRGANVWRGFYSPQVVIEFSARLCGY